MLDPFRSDGGILRRLRGPSGSVVTWLALVAYLVVVKLLSVTLVPITFRGSGQEALFDWTSLGVFAALGLVGVVLAERTGFPGAWDARISNHRRVLLPALAGLGLGMAAVVIDIATGATARLAQVIGQPSFNINFPGSLLTYSAGAILVEVQYRLFTVPFLLFLISGLLLRGHGQNRIFWVLAIVSAGLEPMLQGVGLTLIGGGAITPVMLVGYLLTAVTGNLLQVIVFRRYGLVAPIVQREAYYLVWHILYGNVLFGRGV